MIRWEYITAARTVTHGIDKWTEKSFGQMSEAEVLNFAGEQGWELVSIVHFSNFSDFGGSVKHNDEFHYVFKRPKQ